MKVYLVGGAVRDQLLNREVKERDFVVVGATPEEMIAKGFRPVGKNFPVFLHPKTHEEYALARTERKVAKGYKGFKFCTDPEIVLEDDLKRRDLTINAMARARNGRLIDPFGGQEDLKNKILRHVSEAFAEDPVRVLRVARFSACFGDFKIADETLALMRKIVADGEVDALVPERVWQELNRALAEPYPERFIEVLRECSALKVIFPEIDALFGVPNPPSFHPEIDSGIHTLLVLKQAVKLSQDPSVRFAALVHDLGKALSPREMWPKHHAHGEHGVLLIKKMCRRLCSPREYEDLAVLCARYHGYCHKVLTLRSSTILKLILALDPFRKPERFQKFLLVCKADVKGRKGFEKKAYPQAAFLNAIVEECRALDVKSMVTNICGNSAKELVHHARLDVIRKYKLKKIPV